MIYWISAAVLLLAVQLKAQDNVIAKFAFRSYTYHSISLPYRLFVPAGYTSAKLYPVLLTLHGSGERGSNNTAQLTANRMATAWAESTSQASHPCFVAAPQCPSNSDWSSDEMLSALNGLLDSLSREFTIDTNRFYVTGLSMGGFGTWDMIGHYPGRFAAAVPMSSGSNAANFPQLEYIPIWNFHGARDEAVPVQYSRYCMAQLESMGRKVIYTHCQNNDCTGLPDSTVNIFVSSHADVFYTEYQFGPHEIWNDAYQYPPLHDWLFDKYRLVPDAIRLDSLHSHRKLAGTSAISWNSASASDSVEIWFSADDGGYWLPISRSEPNTGIYQWNTASVPDCPFGLLNIFVKNIGGHIYGSDRSRYISIDNGMNGIPFVKILNANTIAGNTVAADTVFLDLLVGDVDSDSLTVMLSYSQDGAETFDDIAAFTATPDTLGRRVALPISQKANSDRAVIRAHVSDGNSSSSDQTHLFIKRTKRVKIQAVSHVAGTGGGTLAVNIIDQTKLTGHTYRVTFNDSIPGNKTYDVFDVDAGLKVVTGASELDGTMEGPLFDGIRLVLKDLTQPSIDINNSRWLSGDSTVFPVDPTLPRLHLGGPIIQGFPYPANYIVTFFDHIVDTSREAYSFFTSVPVKFTVWNVTAGRKSAFAFYDGDNDQEVTAWDDIFLLEPDSSGSLRMTWSMMFVGTEGSTPPKPGDQYTLIVLTPFTHSDAFEFSTISAGVVETSVPEEIKLYQNYPNPFNPTTKIDYRIADARHISLKVYDLLGREIATLIDGVKQTGEYGVSWDAGSFSSGVYFLRLEAKSINAPHEIFSQTRKIILLK